MKSKHDAKAAGRRRQELPVLKEISPNRTAVSKMSRRRAIVLAVVNLLIIAHVVQWWLGGTTISPVEPSETMFTLQRGALNAGFVFFSLAILATLVFGRFVCGWGCHLLALQDFCAWLMTRFGIKPKPFRSRILVFVPLIVALYMFVWPTVLRIMVRQPGEPIVPPISNHLVTSDFWATFPPLWVAVPFLFACGFMTVYFLGSKGFCTYACPYGGFFAIADKLSPARIRVTDACAECGHCTAVCTSNVLVHAEVKKYGAVVDSGCMKCLDCVSVCPNDALYFGFGKPAIASGLAAKRKYSVSWPEDIFAAVVFFLSFLAFWDAYQLMPMLLALGLAGVSMYVVVKTVQILRASDASFFKYILRRDGKFRRAGFAFVGFAVLWTAFTAHTGWIHYLESQGNAAFMGIQARDELVLARRNPESLIGPADRANAALAAKNLGTARRFGLFTNPDALPKLAWSTFLSGDAESAQSLLADAAARQSGQAKALSLYYRGAILNRMGRYELALASLDEALATRADLVLAREERGESLWKLGKKDDAVASWRLATDENPRLSLAYNFLAAAASSEGRSDESAEFQKLADRNAPDDALYYWMLGLRLQNAGFYPLAEKQFQRAVALNPQMKAVKR